MKSNLNNAIKTAARDGAVSIEEIKQWRTEKKTALYELMDMLSSSEHEKEILLRKRRTKEEEERKQEERWLQKRAELLQQNVP